MPSIGPVECVLCLAPLLVSALFLFAFLKITSAIRGKRELGDRPTATAVEGQEQTPPSASGDGIDGT
jgi:hypothetical protein